MAPLRQVSRLNRELEALEEQRTRARDDAQKADKARIQLEAEIKVCGARACWGARDEGRFRKSPRLSWGP